MDWQQIAALAIVATAVAYLLRNGFKKRPAGESSCGGCGSCGKGEEPKITTIELVRRS